MATMVSKLESNRHKIGDNKQVIGHFKRRHNLKHKISIFSIFLLTVLYACGQKQQTNTASINQQELVDSLKKKVDQKWIIENPSLKPTKSSFFNKNNESKYFVGLLKISGQSVPFTWDDNLSLLNFLLNLENEIKVKHGIDADQNFKGTKIAWDNNISGLIWFNDKAYKATVDNWYLFGFTECPGTIIFPNLSFKKIADIPNAITNNIQGLTILPYDENIKIKSDETIMTTESGKIIKGIGYDIDNDGIFDIFSYNEDIDETTGYTRLYINVSGQWKCKWINLDEVCV
jgi:hypothetical protein